MRYLLPVLQLLLTGAAALADTTATYDVGRGFMTMKVEVADNGAARMSQTVAQANAVARFGYFTPEGGAYMAWQQDGQWMVASFDDITAVMAEAAAKQGVGTADAPAAPDREYRWVERGAETDGGRSGTRFVQEKPDGTESGLDVGISPDPDLAGIGKLFERSFKASTNGLARIMGSAPAMTRGFAPLLERGTLIRMGHVTVLTAVDHARVDPETLKLPAAPLSRDRVR